MLGNHTLRAQMRRQIVRAMLNNPGYPFAWNKKNNESWVSDNKQMAGRVTDYKRYLNQKEKLIRKRVDYLREEKLFGNFSQKREAKNLLINFPVSTNPQYWEKLPCVLALFYNIQCKICRLMLYENVIPWKILLG